MAANGTLDLSIDGMTCASCVASVEGALREVPGVAGARVSLPLRRARVELDPGADEAALGAALEAAVSAAGYRALREPGPGDPAEELLAAEATALRRREAEVLGARRRFLVSLAAGGPLLVLSMGAMLAGVHLPPWTGWLQLGLCAAVMVAAGPIFATALRRARNRSASMETLVALGTLAAAGWSVWQLLRDPHAHLEFEAAGTILLFVLLGRWLEARAGAKTGEALSGLLAVAPATARRLVAGGEETVSLGALRPGDRVRVLPGEALPGDGVVEEGRSGVDEALLTGESVPATRGPGDAVTGGTIAVDGPLVVRLERTGQETRLARIVRLVAEAGSSKAPLERLADRVAGVFVPVILLLAALTGLGWWLAGAPAERVLLTAVAVLVVACPCALGLATPTAVVVAVGRAARLGILLRDAASLERLAVVTHALLDKTGTLTAGRFQVQALRPAEGTSEAELLALAAGLERGSEHPLARAVLAEAERRGVAPLPVAELKVVPGGGVRGTVDGEPVRAGRATWLASAGVDAAGLAQLAAGPEGTTPIAVARGARPLGALFLVDAPREQAREAVAALRAQAIEPVLLTGDREEAARSLARQVGIERIVAGVGPEEKLAELDRLLAGGARPMMVGDGLNDAPALARAWVGVAMGGGTELARVTAQVVLLGDDPRGAALAVGLARRTLRVVRQNLVWAFGYNLVAIPLAAFGVLHPALAAGAMAMSSVLVVANSLRLRR